MHMLKTWLAAILFTLIAGTVLAAPQRVVFYPDSADVTEHFSLPVTDGVATYTIPGRALPDGMTVRAAGKASIVGLSWESVADEDGPAIAALKQQLEKAIVERDTVRSDYKAAQGAIGYLEGMKDSKTPTASDAVQMAQTITDRLKGLYRDMYAHAQKLQPLEEQVKDLEQKIEQARGNAERVWQVTLSVAPGPKTVELQCTYNVPGSGWSPAYRLDGLPARDLIRFGFDAVVVQRTGMDLRDVDMALATTRPHSGVAPPHMPEWVIAPQKDRPAPPVRTAKKAMADNMVMMEAAVGAAAPAPEAKTSFTLWELGKRTAMAGKEMRLNLESSDWPATFKRVARPSVSPSVFVSAEVDLAQAPDLPPGRALFLLDGALVGRRGFNMSTTDKTLFFGEDPLVEVKKELTSKQSGEKGFIGKSQTYDWNWKITCTNGRATPVTLTVEEPQPQSRDKRIELETEYSVTPEIEDKKLLWTFDIAAKGKQEFTYSVRLKAPEDMDLDLGWIR